ncbi:transmembrane protein 179B-like isoform X2 [Chelonia mydas]|uniref:transmembrane protein 179B-like isoform X2 n=1 Tax=Chelonia mydas TaxID=8469 RepID=UPI001CA9132B|nr:transmembrane protein 179B-like isoform X2 [Chelonia mydas]
MSGNLSTHAQGRGGLRDSLKVHGKRSGGMKFSLKAHAQGGGGMSGNLDHTWLTVNLAVSAVILFFLLVSACILRVGMDTLCSSILQTRLVKSCQEAQHVKWSPQYNAARFYDNLYSAEAAAWVNFFFWCLLLVLLLVQRRREAPFQLLQRNDPEWSSETDAIFGARPQRS